MNYCLFHKEDCPIWDLSQTFNVLEAFRLLRGDTRKPVTDEEYEIVLHIAARYPSGTGLFLATMATQRKNRNQPE